MLNFLLVVTTAIIASCEDTVNHSLLKVAKANNEFGFNFYKQISQSEEGNIIFSPLSAQTVLALAYAGANGKTAEQMAKALSLPDKTTTINGFKALQTQLRKNIEDGAIFKIANNIYLNKEIEIEKKYSSLIQDFFNIDSENRIDFNDTIRAAEKINQWVENMTDNKIKHLIKPEYLSNYTQMILINAIYFAGQWEQEFKPTAKMKFYLSETESKYVNAMVTNGRYLYQRSEDLNASLLMIPYKNPDFSMIIILPDDIDGLNTIEKSFPLDMKKLVDGMYERTMVIKLPKFKIESTIDMKNSLMELGMIDAFSNEFANFSGINQILYIDQVLQKAFIDVDEKGTKAAAATSISFLAKSSENRYFTVEWPFFFVVYQQSTNLASFIGRVNKL